MLTKITVEAALNAELDEHLGYDKNQKSNADNYRNGNTSKTLKTEDGQFELVTPRDRNATFEPKRVKKNQTRFTSMDDKDLSEAGYHDDAATLVLKRARQAARAGMGGIVCSAEEAESVRDIVGKEMVEMVANAVFDQLRRLRAGQPVLGLALELRVADENAEHDFRAIHHIIGGDILGLFLPCHFAIISQTFGERGAVIRAKLQIGSSVTQAEKLNGTLKPRTSVRGGSL